MGTAVIRLTICLIVVFTGEPEPLLMPWVLLLYLFWKRTREDTCIEVLCGPDVRPATQPSVSLY